jgi:hypothetical protein
LLEMRWTGFERKQTRKVARFDKEKLVYQCQENHQRTPKSWKRGRDCRMLSVGVGGE